MKDGPEDGVYYDDIRDRLITDYDRQNPVTMAKALREHVERMNHEKALKEYKS